MRLHILTGVTAVGKTARALQWAADHNAEIISCDATLFYRGMDIGAAKPTPAERAAVPHHLIDTNDVSEPMDVARYTALARQAAAGIRARGREVLVTGGSGFYLKAWFTPVADAIAVPPEIRARVAALFETEKLPALLAELRRLNPGGLGALDTANPRRVTRALERCLASGRTLADQKAAFDNLPPPFAGWEIHCAELTRDPADTDARVCRRAAAMLDAGLVDEVRRLRALGLEKNPAAVSAIGYRETLAHLDGGLSRDALLEAIVQRTRRLVRKQRAWFRTQLPPHRLVPADSAAPLF
ncbi:MAG: tRNA (adenosine(37)-N6)-dimethylallyltransferase MiaA [Opitutaceae bacterium]|jgi:tRNA dimethylallyltransferase|nr:tRNA (adenosine(37)-N6)-dimethylallyltransferase MiaA [Opitutaceae bacterium]